MKSHRFQIGYREGASRLHKLTGEALRASEGPFLGYKIYQEYPVNRVLKTYKNSRHKFDWVILDLFLVIECHGEAHYGPVQFGGISKEDAEINFRSQQVRDESKREAAISAGFTYVIVPYWDLQKITPDYIWTLYKQNINDKMIVKEPRKVSDSYQEKRKEAARQYRKQQYRRWKECRASARQLKEVQDGPQSRFSKCHTQTRDQKVENKD
jgi:hypothetical protein